MDSFEQIIKKYIADLSPDSNKFSPRGRNYFIENDTFYGNYWFYESKDFIIDIHDFYIKKDYVDNDAPDMSSYLFLMSKYIISASGEWLDPYQAMESNSMLIIDTMESFQKYLLHGGSRYFMVGIMFKDSIVDKYLSKDDSIRINDVSKIFMETKNEVVKPISKLSKEILNCKLDGLSADLFFEAKAMEWLSITLDAYENIKEPTFLKDSDVESIKVVAKYIDDHYAMDINQSFLEKIATMSGTKLKNTFKKTYNMTITEYTQRKRINVAENLLLSTDLEIKDIAKSVGYNSPSRFSNLFRRYKGVNPNDMRKFVSIGDDISS